MWVDPLSVVPFTMLKVPAYSLSSLVHIYDMVVAGFGIKILYDENLLCLVLFYHSYITH